MDVQGDPSAVADVVLRRKKYVAIEGGVYEQVGEEPNRHYLKIMWVNGTYVESARAMAERVAILMNADDVCTRLKVGP